MKKSKISFRVIGDSGPLTISWFTGPKGNAIEAKNGIGVVFFSSDGTLLCVEFDDMKWAADHQILEFDRYRVEAFSNKGEISHSVTELKAGMKKSKPSKKGRRKETGNEAA